MLTSKQRAYLKSLGSNMDAIFQIGKQGASPEVVKALDDALEARELIKISVLKNCFDDIHALTEVIASRTHSEPVQIIGHKILLYRPKKKDPKLELPK